MSGPDTTPPVSPLRDDSSALNQSRSEVEDGELTSGSLSDVSDEAELEDGELEPSQEGRTGSTYDCGRYFRDRSGVPRQARLEDVITDSPASPETVQLVTGSPVRMIPASPPPERVDNGPGGWVKISSPGPSEGEEEDLDEDILYLRLIALRSLAVEEKSEMEQLLEEADEAAREELGSNQSVTEVITIDDDDDPISEMKLHLHESFIKYQQSVEVVEVLDDSPSYSPTQSPSLSLSPIYIAPDGGDEYSPPLSPVVGFNSASSIPFPPGWDPSPPLLPSPPPLPPSTPPCPPPPRITLSRPPPPPPPAFPEPVPTTSTGEPLPPGEDTPVSLHAHKPPSPILPKPEDMDLEDSADETTAEDKFFKGQKELAADTRPRNGLFPPSVWEFTNENSVRTEAISTSKERVRVRDRKRKSESKGTGRKKRKRKSSTRDKENLQKSVSVDEDEESLRAILLAQMSKGREKKVDCENELDRVLPPETKEIAETVEDNGIPTPKGLIQEEREKPENNHKITNATKFKKIAPLKAISKRSQVRQSGVRRLSSTSKTSKSLKLKRPKSETILNSKISKADQMKHFPNLSKRIVIPLTEYISDDTDEEYVQDVPVKFVPNGSNSANVLPLNDPRLKKTGTSSLFGANLEAFLKEARESKISTPAVPNKKIAEAKTKKIFKTVLTPKQKAQARNLSLADKKRLITANIEQLDRSKQLEYQRLKVMLEKKLAEKQLRKGNSTTSDTSLIALKENANDKSNNDECTENVEDDETALRLRLIENMNQKKNAAVSKPLKTNEAANQDGSSKNTLSKNLPEITKASEEVKIAKENIKNLISPKKNASNNLKVVVSGDSRNVKVDDGHETVADDISTNDDATKVSPQGALGELETGVVTMRKTLSTSLFKLSAYMSQLKKESIGVESGLKYADELRRQLRETEELVASRQAKVENLREVIRGSHQQIIKERQDMNVKEDECRVKGLQVIGDGYKPPSEGADNIRRKLAQIKNTAMRVKTTTSWDPEQSTDQAEKQTVIDDKEAETGSGICIDSLASKEVARGAAVGTDYCSPLAHIGPAAATGQIDPHTQLCKFQLAGKCLDQHCLFQHCGKEAGDC